MASRQSHGARLERAAIVFGGPQDEQADFLQSLVTNDVSAATAQRLVYAALLTPQGKYLSDFFVMRTQDGDYMLDVAASQAGDLAKRLTMYKLRRPITLERRDLAAAAIWGGEAPAGGLPDPRDPALGWRVYGEINTDTALAAAEAGDYDRHRLSLTIPESDTDLIPNDTYILEAGFERMNGVDFRKGCYVGQEIVARMKHKTELRKRYVKVAVSGPVPPGTAITNDESKPTGMLYSNSGGVGIALLRLDRAEKSTALSSGAVTVKQA